MVSIPVLMGICGVLVVPGISAMILISVKVGKLESSDSHKNDRLERIENKVDRLLTRDHH